MKKLIIVLLSVALMSLANAEELKIEGYIKSDPLRGGNNYLIFSKNGKAAGRIAPDLTRPSNSGYYRIYNKKGNQIGKIRPDYIDNRRYIIETDKDD